MLKAEIGDYLYYIIFAIVFIIGAIDKSKKAKRQQASPPRVPQSSKDDFGDVDEQQRPQSLEELMRRMLQTTETPEPETLYNEPESSLDVSYINAYQPIVDSNNIQYTPVAVEEETVKVENYEFEFDIRQAVIANEILNRKY